jgi:hypothetical protein
MAGEYAEGHAQWRAELSIYLCFTVSFSFFPIVCLYLVRASYGYYSTLPELAADGGILTIAISLAADALSRLVASGSKWHELKVIAAACSAWVIGCGSLLYALRHVGGVTNSTLFGDLGFLILIASVGLATFCRFLPEDNR